MPRLTLPPLLPPPGHSPPDTKKPHGVVGSFAELDRLLAAVDEARAGKLDFEVFSPVPHHEIEEHCKRPRSWVPKLTFLGAVAGLFTGLALTIGTSLWNDLNVGGKPIVSIPPFLVVAFELTILLGGLITLGAILYFARLPRKPSPGYHPRFSDDRFGLFVRVGPERAQAIEALLQRHGAESVWRTDAPAGEPRP